MLRKFFFSFVFLGAVAFAQEGDDWTQQNPAEQDSFAEESSVVDASAANASVAGDSAKQAVPAEVAAPAAPKIRKVAARYWIQGDSVEQEAFFVKIEKDTVFLKRPTEKQLKRFARLAEEANAELQRSNGQQVEEIEDDEEEEDIVKPVAEVIMTDAVKESVAAQSETVSEASVEDDGADDDLETAMAKEDDRKKMEEIAKVEEEIRQREIQDSIAEEAANPFIKIYRLDLKRLYNMEDEVMIDLSLSDYVVPEIVEEEEKIELYPPGKANLFVESVPAACSLFVNGIPLKQVAPDTIKNIKPGKYTISVMQVIKDVELWGTAVIRINADSLNRISIPVQKPATRLTVNTDPEVVEVFVNEEPSEYVMPHFVTDVIVEDVKPQVDAKVYLRKVGYRDTSLTVEIRPYMPNLVHVEMTPVLDVDFIQTQKAYDRRRSNHRIGRGLLWSSIAPVVASGVLWFLAERDWSKAADKKYAYDKLAAFDSDDTRKMLKDNHRLNDSGDKKFGAAAGLGVLGIGLLTAGFILAF